MLTLCPAHATILGMKSGPEQLAEWKERRFTSSTEAADYLGIDKSIFTKLKNGTRRAGLRMALHIQQQTGIPVESWASVAEDRPARPRIGKRRKAR